jgi:hypothetical protein
LAVFAALMLSLCRSWAIAGGIALSAAAIPLSEINTPFMNMLSFTFSGDLGWYPYSVVYITGIGIIPLIWAIRERGRVFPDTACQSCGYDLRGLEAAACPECGAAVDHD